MRMYGPSQKAADPAHACDQNYTAYQKPERADIELPGQAPAMIVLLQLLVSLLCLADNGGSLTVQEQPNSSDTAES
jgi:hypothetical protein